MLGKMNGNSSLDNELNEAIFYVDVNLNMQLFLILIFKKNSNQFIKKKREILLA